VVVHQENDLKEVYGRVKCVDGDTSYTVDLVGGGRRVGVVGLDACTEEDLAIREAPKLPRLMDKRSPSSDSLICSEAAHLNGVAITRQKSARGLWP
jgi:hypothetical protein